MKKELKTIRYGELRNKEVVAIRTSLSETARNEMIDGYIKLQVRGAMWGIKSLGVFLDAARELNQMHPCRTESITPRENLSREYKDSIANLKRFGIDTSHYDERYAQIKRGFLEMGVNL